ncbi:MAG: hydroxyquinol 1,2-dioxygenase [Proteobacteria bacterium]|nr:hydroxyquinol 1,2-dioxygenase [Pseudomonadota bacterium]
MQLIDEDTITQAVIARHARAADPRLRDLMTSLVQHLHAFAREVRLTDREWQAGLRLLAEAGRLSQGPRHEFALLSDTLGVSALVAAMAPRRAAGRADAGAGAGASAGALPAAIEATEATEAGRAAPLPNAETADGAAPCFLRGQVRGTDGRPVPGAELLLGADGTRLPADAQGRFQARVQAVAAQPLPTDGPTGALLRSLGRSAWRPAYVPVCIRAAGYRTLRTQLFRRGDRHLDADAAFGVRRSLVADWRPHDSGPAPDGSPCERPFHTVDFDFVLEPA